MAPQAYQHQKFNQIWAKNNQPQKESYSVINAKLARDNTQESSHPQNPSQAFWEQNSASEACSAAEFSQNSESFQKYNSEGDTQPQENTYITINEMKEILLQQNKRHEEILKQQQEKFELHLSKVSQNSSLSNLANNTKSKNLSVPCLLKLSSQIFISGLFILYRPYSESVG
jgi:hypothetical protein